LSDTLILREIEKTVGEGERERERERERQREREREGEIACLKIFNNFDASYNGEKHTVKRCRQTQRE
jgi:hypothetical protein